MKKALITFLAVTTVLGNGLTAFAAPEAMTDGTLFDAEYYAENNPDVAAELGTDANALYQHYVNFGKTEGRLAVVLDTASDEVLFDAEYYAQNNPDVVAELGTDASVLYQHYVDYGKAEGRLAAASDTSVVTATAEPVPAAENSGIMSLSDWLNLDENAAQMEELTASLSGDGIAITIEADGDVFVMKYTFSEVVEINDEGKEAMQRMFDAVPDIFAMLRDSLIEETGNPNIKIRVAYINGDGSNLYTYEF